MTASSNMTVRFMVPEVFLMSTAQTAFCSRVSEPGKKSLGLSRALGTPLGPRSLQRGLESHLDGKSAQQDGTGEGSNSAVFLGESKLAAKSCGLVDEDSNINTNNYMYVHPHQHQITLSFQTRNNVFDVPRVATDQAADWIFLLMHNLLPTVSTHLLAVGLRLDVTGDAFHVHG